MTQKANLINELLGLGLMDSSSDPLRSHQCERLTTSEVSAAPTHAYHTQTPAAVVARAPAATTSRRRATPTAPRSETDIQGKRKRHADAERERIHRKQSEVSRMRAVVEQLEKHLHSLSAVPSQAQQDVAMASPWYSELLEDTVLSHDLGDAEKRELYIRALTQSGWLRREKASLQTQLSDYGLLEAGIEGLLKDLIDATIHEPIPPSRQSIADETIRKITYQDVLSEECYEMMRDLVSESKHFTIQAEADAHVDRSPHHQSDHHAIKSEYTTSFDWAALCEHDDNDVRFSMTKTFPDGDLHELSTSAWQAFHVPSVSQTVFSSRHHLEVLQRINDDVCIVRWQIVCGKTLPYVAHCRNLVFRWETDDGYFIGCRTIDALEPVHPTQVKSNPTEGAFDQFYWAKFTHDPSGRGCQVTFAGRVGVGNGTSAFARFLATEIPIVILRWESMVVGPLFNFSLPDDNAVSL